MRELKIGKNSGQRLDKFLMKYFNDAPKSLIYKLLRKKRIKLNMKKAQGNEILENEDVIQLYIAPETMDNMRSEKEAARIDCKFDIIYEDENILIANKPSGLLVHSDGKSKDNLNDAVLYYLYQKNEYDTSKEGVFKPAVCNRLDRNTSGIVTFGKNLHSVQALSEIFRENNADKYYLALVCGKVEDEKMLKGYYIKDTKNNKAYIYDKKLDGSQEVSIYYKPKKYFEGCTVLEVKLFSGKSHQIRVMLAGIGHSIVGDTKYGKGGGELCKRYNIKNQMLHCCRFVIKKSQTLKYLEGKEFLCPFAELEKILGEKI